MELSDRTKVAVIMNRVETRRAELLDNKHREVPMQGQDEFLQNLQTILEADTPPAEDPVKLVAKALEYIRHEQFKKDMKVMWWSVKVAIGITTFVGLLMWIF